MFDPMADLADEAAGNDPTSAPSSDGDGFPKPPPARRDNGGSGGGAQYGQEIHSITIHARQRTFYIDLKASGNGKFFKISEKSRGGRKTTIMFDAEDLDSFINAMQEMKTKM